MRAHLESTGGPSAANAAGRDTTEACSTLPIRAVGLEVGTRGSGPRIYATYGGLQMMYLVYVNRERQKPRNGHSARTDRSRARAPATSSRIEQRDHHRAVPSGPYNKHQIQAVGLPIYIRDNRVHPLYTACSEVRKYSNLGAMCLIWKT